MTNSIQIEKTGRRYYLRGNTYPVKDALRAAGGHWDAAEKAWWTSNQEVAERFAGAATEAAAKVEAVKAATAGEAKVPVNGNTYPVRDQLRAMGGEWDAAAKVWVVPVSQEAAAKALVAGAGERQAYRPKQCKQCGARPNVRGWPRIYRNGICSDCYSDACDD
jgi:hypothetical protein